VDEARQPLSIFGNVSKAFGGEAANPMDGKVCGGRNTSQETYQHTGVMNVRPAVKVPPDFLQANTDNKSGTAGRR
jgi:hypothetical protein